MECKGRKDSGVKMLVLPLGKLTTRDTFKFEASLYHMREDVLIYLCIYSFSCIFEYLLHAGPVPGPGYSVLLV